MSYSLNFHEQINFNSSITDRRGTFLEEAMYQKKSFFSDVLCYMQILNYVAKLDSFRLLLLLNIALIAWFG